MTVPTRALASQRYLYAVLPAVGESERAPRGVEYVCAAGLAAALGPVPHAVRVLGGARAQADHQPDLREALAEAAFRHQEVVTELWQQHPAILPLRMGAAVTSRADARALLEAHATAFSERLAAVTGRREWGFVLKFLPEAGEPESGDRAAGRADADAAPRATVGHQYLARRLAARDAARESERRCHEHARRAVDLLAAAGQVTVRAGMEVDEETGRSVCVLRGAVLVLADEEDGLFAAVDRLAAKAPGSVVRLSGPWPPYSFSGTVGSE